MEYQVESRDSSPQGDTIPLHELYPAVYPYAVSRYELLSGPCLAGDHVKKQGGNNIPEPLTLRPPRDLSVLRGPIHHPTQPIPQSRLPQFHYNTQEHWNAPRVSLLILLLFVAIACRSLPRAPMSKRQEKNQRINPSHTPSKHAGTEPNPVLNPTSLIYLTVLSILLCWLLHCNPGGWLRAYLPTLLAPESQTIHGCLLLWATILITLLLWRLIQCMGLRLMGWLGNLPDSQPTPSQLRMQIPLPYSWILCLASILLLLLPINLTPYPWALHILLWLAILPDALGIGKLSSRYFKAQGGQLHFFLYLCTVELIPYIAILTCTLDY